MDERRAARGEGGRQRRHVLDQLEHAAPTSASTASPNASQAASNCLGRMSTPSRSRSEMAGDRERQPVAQGREVGHGLVPELRPHGGGAAEHEAVLVAGEGRGRRRAARRSRRASRPTRRRPRARRPRWSGRRLRACGEHAVGEQQRLAAGVARGAAEPVGAGHDPLRDQRAPVGEHEPVDAVAGPAARRERGALGDLAEPANSCSAASGTGSAGGAVRGRRRRSSGARCGRRRRRAGSGAGARPRRRRRRARARRRFPAGSIAAFHSIDPARAGEARAEGGCASAGHRRRRRLPGSEASRTASAE